MKNYLLTTLFFIVTYAYGQHVRGDINLKRTPVKSVKYNTKINFSLIENLQLWNYSIDTTYHGRESNSIKSIGQLIFWRKKPMPDTLFKYIPNNLWSAAFTFDIFTIADTNYCYRWSRMTRSFSSCVPPNVGGDMIIIDKYVFLNDDICLNCERYGTKADYCRPVINYVFSKLDRSKISTIQSLVQQFVIAKRERQK
jgi:hypothetical protein